jgi:hypothetical protein
MTAEDTTRREWTLSYRGDPGLANLFAQLLREQGVRVEFESFEEHRDTGEIIDLVVSNLITYGTIAGVKAAFAQFRKRRPAVDAKIEETDRDETPS